MATSKRSLYSAAPSQTPPPHTRKSLAQGLLVSKPMVAFVSSPTTPQRETSKHGRPLSSPMHTSQSTSLLLEKENIHVQQDSRRESPNRAVSTSHQGLQTPGQSMTRSPFPEQMTLDHTSPVLLVDASGRHKSPDLAEVPVVTSIVKSPVRVVCHSPRGTMKEREVVNNSVIIQRSDNANTVTGHTDGGRRVQITGVPSVNILDSSGRKKEASPSIQSPDSLASGSSIGISPVDHESMTAKAGEEHGQRTETAEQFKSFLGEEGPLLSANLSPSEIKQQLFDFSDTHTQLGTDANQSILPGDEKHDKKSKKKKQKTRIVPSRYMAKAKAGAKVPGNLKETVSTRKKVKGSTSIRFLNDQPPLPHQNTSAMDLDVITPYMRRSFQQKGVVTSTPADGLAAVNLSEHMGAPTPILPQGVATSAQSNGVSLAVKKTAVHDKHKSLAVSKKVVKTRAGGPSQTTGHMEAMAKLPPKKTPSTEPSHTTAADADREVSQRQLELQFSRVVQASFLFSKLKHSFAQKEKDAQAQMYSVWQEKEKLQREVADLELELRMKNKIAELDKQLQLQMSGLKPVGSHMVKLILEYSQLAAALDTTRHHMSVNGVLMPANHDQLLAALDESERLLGEIDALTKHNQQNVGTFAKEIEGLSSTVESEIQEQKRCREMLAAASTLNTQEQSLQAQSIMDGL